MKFKTKVHPSPQSCMAETAPNGTKISMREKGDQKISTRPRFSRWKTENQKKNEWNSGKLASYLKEFILPDRFGKWVKLRRVPPLDREYMGISSSQAPRMLSSSKVQGTAYGNVRAKVKPCLFKRMPWKIRKTSLHVCGPLLADKVPSRFAVSLLLEIRLTLLSIKVSSNSWKC